MRYQKYRSNIKDQLGWVLVFAVAVLSFPKRVLGTQPYDYDQWVQMETSLTAVDYLSLLFSFWNIVFVGLGLLILIPVWLMSRGRGVDLRPSVWQWVLVFVFPIVVLILSQLTGHTPCVGMKYRYYYGLCSGFEDADYWGVVNVLSRWAVSWGLITFTGGLMYVSTVVIPRIFRVKRF